jgi:hypothetical protein
LITAKALSAIGSRSRTVFSNAKSGGGQTLSPTMIQLRICIGVRPVTVGTVVVKTTAAEPSVTVMAYIKMVTAEILLTNRT